MTERTILSEVTFAHPFRLSGLTGPLEAGTYRLIIDEELVEGLSFAAYRQVASRLEIPAVGMSAAVRQSLAVDLQELGSALFEDSGRLLKIGHA